MKFIKYGLLLAMVLLFSGCYHYGHVPHHSGHYYTTYPVMYEYVPVSPVINTCNIHHH